LRADSLREAHFDEPDRFKPERWLADAGPSASSANRVSMPFGAGPRAGPGRHLAMREIKRALAVLLGRFEIESVAPTRTGAAADEPAEELAFSMAPEPLTLRLRRRSGDARAAAPWPATAASACSQSAIRSAAASRPIEKRTT